MQVWWRHRRGSCWQQSKQWASSGAGSTEAARNELDFSVTMAYHMDMDMPHDLAALTFAEEKARARVTARGSPSGTATATIVMVVITYSRMLT